MLKDERQQKIIEIVYKNGSGDVNKLCEVFMVSHDTIRRDLMELEEQGEIRRVFGGAVPSKRTIPNYHERLYKDKDRKIQVARKALPLLKNNQLIAIDGGTTNCLFASQIPHSLSLTVITNSFFIAQELINHKNIRTIVLGGEFFDIPMVTGGATAIEQMELYHPDIFFLGVGSVDFNDGVTVAYQQEVSIKRQICRQSGQIVCLCTHEKLKHRSKYKICDIEDIDYIATDELIDKDIQNFPVKILL